MSTKKFEVTPKPFINQTTETEGKFEFDLLPPGYGHTIGNSLRRVLTSSLEGYAITCIKLPEGVLHEFATIKGVLQDISEIILNLKRIRFKKIGNEDKETLMINFKNKTTFKAGDLSEVSRNFETLNPDLTICTMDESADFQLGFKIEKGTGYVPVEERKNITQIIGQIPIDAIFTPIKNVAYKVVNTLVGNRLDYDKIIMEIKTDGSITPREALQSSATKLIDHLSLLVDKNALLREKDNPEKFEIDQKHLLMQKKLQKPLRDLQLSVRTFNCLKTNNCECLGDIVELTPPQLMRCRNFGRTSMKEIEKLLEKEKLSMGMDISAYKLEPEEEKIF